MSDVSAPTPAQIAERAYDTAITTAMIALGLSPALDAVGLRDHMQRAKGADLAAIRESVVNPGAIPWWKK